MSARSKVYSSFNDAVCDIPDGATLGFGGFAVVGMPINLYQAVAKQRAKIPVDSDVELVVYPPRKSFYELVSEQLSGSGDQVASAWMAANLTKGEVEALRMLRGPAAIFRRGELMALMPFTFLR